MEKSRQSRNGDNSSQTKIKKNGFRTQSQGSPIKNIM